MTGVSDLHSDSDDEVEFRCENTNTLNRLAKGAADLADFTLPMAAIKAEESVEQPGQLGRRDEDEHDATHDQR